jgi:flagellar motor switch protein FliG
MDPIGVEKVAILLMSLSEEQTTKIVSLLTEDEILEISRAIHKLGMVKAQVINTLCRDFLSTIQYQQVVGGEYSAKNLMQKAFPQDKMPHAMEVIKSPPGKTIWEKLSHCDDQDVFDFLSHQHPQTIAIILSRLNPEKSSIFLKMMDNNNIYDILTRISKMTEVPFDALACIEEMIKEFIDTLYGMGDGKNHHIYVNHTKVLANIMNYLGDDIDQDFFKNISKKNPDIFKKVQPCVNRLDCVNRLNKDDFGHLLNAVDLRTFVKAIKGEPYYLYVIQHVPKDLQMSMKHMTSQLQPTPLEKNFCQKKVMDQLERLSKDGQLSLSFMNEENCHD